MASQKKVDSVKVLKERVAGKECILLVNFNGLNSVAITNLRKKVRQSDGGMFVAKNTLVEIAVNGTEHECIKPLLAKETAFITAGKDAALTAKAVYEFATDNQQLTIKGGVLNGRMLTAEQVTALAKLPSREVLIAQLLGTLNAPIYGFVNVLAGTIRKFIYALEAVKEQKAKG